MLVPVLILQLAGTASRPNPVYSSPSLETFIAAAAAANHAPPASLRAYRARVESELSLLVRDTLGRERAAQVEQIAMRAAWERGRDYELRVVGYRSQTVGVPYSALSLARSWTIPYLYGDRLTLGVDVGQMTGAQRRRGGGQRDSLPDTSAQQRRRASDTMRAIHPLAIDRELVYRYSGGDTIAILRARNRNIPIVRVRVRPEFDSATRQSRIGAFDGEIDFDAQRHQVVRMRGQFVATPGPRSRRYSVARLPGIVAVAYVEFVNAEVNGEYWLPAFQRSEFQASFAPLGSGRSIFRLVSRFADLDVAQADSVAADSSAGVATLAGSATSYRRQLTYAPTDSVDRYREWMQPLGAATSNVAGSDFDDLAPDAWRLTGSPRFSLAPTKLDEIFRFNRVEGAYTGLAMKEQFRDAFPGLTVRAYGGWAWSENTVRGGAAATYRRGANAATARLERMLATTNDFVTPLENGGEGFGALLGGIDDQDYVDRLAVTAGLTRSIGSPRGAVTVIEAGIGEDRPELARLDRTPLGIGRFRLNRASLAGHYARGSAIIELHPDVTGVFLEPGVGMTASYEIAGGQLSWQRAELTIAARKNVSDLVIAARAQGGIVVGDPLPPQQLFELGGENALPGYRYKEFAGDRAAAAGVLIGYSFPLLRRPWRLVRSLIVPGLSPGIAAGLGGGWVEASSAAARQAIHALDSNWSLACEASSNCPAPLSSPTGGIRATVDARLTFFGGLLGVGVARPIDQAAPWRLTFRFGQEY